MYTSPLVARGLCYRIRNLLVLSLFLPCLSAAAPVRDTSTSSNWLACLMALLVFSAVCLSASKFLFVHHRKTSILRGPPSALPQGRYLHRFLRFLKLPAYTKYKNDKGYKAGFLIGFFGSPSFEIRPKPSEITLIYPGVDTSKTSQTHDVSGDSSTTYKSKASTISAGPVVLFDDNYNGGQVKKDASLSAARAVKSRFLLPTQLSFDLSRIRRKKLTQNQVSASTEALQWPHNRLEHATLRLVKLYTEPETVLPLSRDIKSVPGLPTPVAQAHSFAVTYLNRHHPIPISPLPCLPTPGAKNSQTRDALLPESASVGDHPYNNPLLNLVKPGRHNIRRASLSPNLSIIEETCQGSLSECPSISPLDQPEVLLGANEQLKEIRAYEKNLPITYSAYDTLKRREKLRSPILRNRRSPPLGPSPLRSMILPETVEANIPPVNETKNQAMPQRQSIQCHPIGLGLPSMGLPVLSEDQMKFRDTINTSEGRESVLNFLRELAEETKEWDESIVLDEGFRNMIQRSQAIFDCASLENTNIKCSAPLLSGAMESNKTPPRLVSFWIEDSPTP